MNTYLVRMDLRDERLSSTDQKLKTVELTIWADTGEEALRYAEAMAQRAGLPFNQVTLTVLYEQRQQPTNRC